MARGNPSKKKKPVSPERHAHGAPEQRGPSKGRLRVLIGLMVILLCVLIGRWVYQCWTGPLPELPLLTLDGVDPEVADVLTKQRATVEQSPRSAEAWARLGMLFYVHQFADEAVICYSAAETLDGTNPIWPYFQGYLLQKGAHPDRALPCLERASALAPNEWPLPRLRLADLLLSLGRIEDAEKEYRNVLATNTDNKYARFYAQFGLAQVMIARQDYQDALPLLQALVDDPYTRKRACALRAAVYERLGKRPESDRERLRFATLPDDESLPDIATEALQAMVGWRGRISRANSLQNDNQPAEALKLLIETAEKYPHIDQVWAALGVAKENMNDFPGAEEAYRRSIALAPDRAEHRFNFGLFLQARERYKEAATVFRETIELRPFDAATHFRLGACLQSLGDNPGAAEAYRKALRYNPELNDARQHLEMLTTKK